MRRVQNRNYTSASVQSQLRRVQDRALSVTVTFMQEHAVGGKMFLETFDIKLCKRHQIIFLNVFCSFVWNAEEKRCLQNKHTFITKLLFEYNHVSP